MKKIAFLLVCLQFVNPLFSQQKSTKDQIETVRLENELTKEKMKTLELKIEILQKDIEELKKNIQSLTATISNTQQTKSVQPPVETKLDQNISNGSLPSTQVNSSKSTSTPASYGQCKANTKKGTRCSRSAKANGYCWQHGG